MKRRAVREIALKALFAHELGKNDPGSILQVLWEEVADGDEGAKSFCKHLVEGVISNLAVIDCILEKNAAEWSLKRLAAVDRNVIRIAIFEMLYAQDIPIAVSVNEAIELGKKFGGEESASFINGILDQIGKTITKPEIKKQ